MTPTRGRLAEEPELRDRLIRYIATRDRISVDSAKNLFNGLSQADAVRLELEMRDRAPQRFAAEYDPLG